MIIESFEDEVDAVQFEVYRLRRAGFNIAMTSGIFDLYHPGHVKLLYSVATRTNAIVVAVNDSAYVGKGKDRPVFPLDWRLQCVDSHRSTSLVVGFSDDTPGRMIDVIRPDLYFKCTTSGYPPELESRPWVNFHSVSPYPDCSTTRIINAVRNSERLL